MELGLVAHCHLCGEPNGTLGGLRPVGGHEHTANSETIVALAAEAH
jgi:hypothetical protein